MSNFTHTTSALHAASVHAMAPVVPTPACTSRSAQAAIATWSKQLPVAPEAAGAVKANRNKGAVGAPGFWDPV